MRPRERGRPRVAEARSPSRQLLGRARSATHAHGATSAGSALCTVQGWIQAPGGGCEPDAVSPAESARGGLLDLVHLEHRGPMWTAGRRQRPAITRPPAQGHRSGRVQRSGPTGTVPACEQPLHHSQERLPRRPVVARVRACCSARAGARRTGGVVPDRPPAMSRLSWSVACCTRTARPPTVPFPPVPPGCCVELLSEL